MKNGNSNNKGRDMMFVRLLNFGDEANKIVNKAIRISGDAKSQDVNAVHLFLAILDSTSFGQTLLSNLCTTYNMIYSSFQTLAEEGVYGRFDSSNVQFKPDFFSQEIFTLGAICSQKAYMTGKEVSPELLIDELFKLDSPVLEQFFEYVNITLDDIKAVRSGELYIPDDIADFVDNIHESAAVVDSTIINVDKYTDEMIEILSRKMKANPCLIGEAGVGKTTIVNRLAQRINDGDVPENLKNTKIVYINGSTLSSGTRYRGDFEARMKSIMEWACENNVILFLDEIHTFINSGETGHNDGATAGNMIKKYLSDGSIKIIGATTLKEYHKAIEADKAFNRRLQKIVIKEPSVNEAIAMIKLSICDYVKFHNIEISDEIIEMAVKLSDRYIKDNFLPDKAYTILDQACAKAKLSGNKSITEKVLLSTVSKLTGIDVNKLGKRETKQLLNLEDTLGKRLIGQEKAISTVCKAIRRAKAGVREPNKPLASFLFVGPTGVGKTELCKVLSEEVAFGENPLIKIDMSEFGEKSSVSRLLGTTAGYVGYGEGGQLTEKVKHNPYSIILFDEIEKAHPDVFNTFLQLLDEGKLTDGEGTTVDFTNCIIVMTSNAGYGADSLMKKSLGFGNDTSAVSDREIEQKALKALEDTFRPEFLNRIDNLVIFDKITKEQCKKITKLMLNKLHARLLEQNINIKFDDSLVTRIAEQGYSDKYGARHLRREIQDTVEDFVSDAILSGELNKGDCKTLVFKDNSIAIKGE